MQTKACKQCGKEKSLDEFFADSKGKFGRGAKCKDCFYESKGKQRPIEKPVAKTGYKICSKCNEEKAIGEFYPDKRASDGLASQCKLCNKKYAVKDIGKLDYLKDIPEEPTGMRYCTECRTMKPVVEFAVYKGGKFLRRQCNECKRLADKIYAKEHYEEHRTYIEKNAEYWQQYNKDYFVKNRELLVSKMKLYRKMFPIKVKQIIATSRKKKPELYRHISRMNASVRRSRESLVENTLTIIDWENALAYFRESCAICGKQATEGLIIVADHWLPVSKGYGATLDNIVPLCHSKQSKSGVQNSAPGCNNKKGSKMPEDWLKETYTDSEVTAILKRINDYFEWAEAEKEKEGN